MFNLFTPAADGALVLTWVLFKNWPWKQVEESISFAQYVGSNILRRVDKYNTMPYGSGSLE